MEPAVKPGYPRKQAARPAIEAAWRKAATHAAAFSLARLKPAVQPALSAEAGREARYRGGLTRAGVARGGNSYSRNDTRFVTLLITNPE